MACFNLDMQMEPVLARIDRVPFHQRLEHFRRTGSGSFSSTILACFSLWEECIPDVQMRPVVTLDHIVCINMRGLVGLHQPTLLELYTPIIREERT